MQANEHAQALVARMEILDAIDNAFAPPPATKHQIIAMVEGAQARGDLVELLRQLPDRHFDDVRDLWEHLPDVPVGV